MHALYERPGHLVGRREVLTVEGADAARFLQGQLSQDVEGLAPGESAWSFLLEPGGHPVAWFRVHRVGPERFVIDVTEGFGEMVEARLRRFLLRVEVTIGCEVWEWIALRGPGAATLPIEGTGAALASPVDWPGARGLDLLGRTLRAPGGSDVVTEEAYTALRIESGVPEMGAEIDESIIPAESGVVPISVSFTKGCYTGQELVARVDSRGNNTPYRLHGLLVESADGAVPAPGAEVVVGGDTVGRVTSSARSVRLGVPVALAYVHRRIEVGAAQPVEVVLRWSGGEVMAEVVPLPLVTRPTAMGS